MADAGYGESASTMIKIDARDLLRRELGERGITTPATMNEALDRSAADMVRLLARYHCAAEPTQL